MIKEFFLVKEIVSKEGEVHFRRYRLLSTPWFNIYLHEIRRSDEDAHRHDHPWSFRSLILKGSYSEEVSYHHAYHRIVRSHTYVEGQLVQHDARDAHRLTLKTPVVWTLVLTSGRERVWGYQTKQGWIDFKTYRQLKRDGKLPK